MSTTNRVRVEIDPDAARRTNASEPVPVRDRQTVRRDGTKIMRWIDGVKIHSVTTHADARGTLTEVHNEQWGLVDSPIMQVVKITVRPGKVKGWAKHKLNIDRTTVIVGELKIVLYDDRPESPTYRLVNEFFLGPQHPGVLVIPAHVFHAVQNIGTTDAVALVMPTRPFDYEAPDKYRLPPNNDLIPYRFEEVLGW